MHGKEEKTEDKYNVTEELSDSVQLIGFEM
jgi:hypothetical protein